MSITSFIAALLLKVIVGEPMLFPALPPAASMPSPSSSSCKIVKPDGFGFAGGACAASSKIAKPDGFGFAGA
jgi:hypothetical protein